MTSTNSYLPLSAHPAFRNGGTAAALPRLSTPPPSLVSARVSQSAAPSPESTSLTLKLPYLSTVSLPLAPLKQAAHTAKNLTEALALTGVGLLTHKLPTHMPKEGKFLFPVDWKVFARIFLGLAVVRKLNEALDWKPPTWAGALEAVAIINTIALGVGKKQLVQMAVIGPLVAVIVQAASLLHQKVSKPVKDTLNVPPPITRLAIFTGFSLIGWKLNKPLLEAAQSAIVKNFPTWGKNLMKDGGLLTGASLMTTSCARNCSPGSIICMTELGEAFGPSLKEMVTPSAEPSTQKTSPPQFSRSLRRVPTPIAVTPFRGKPLDSERPAQYDHRQPVTIQ